MANLGITGFNATVAIVDDGLDMYSKDLKDNYVRHERNAKYLLFVYISSNKDSNWALTWTVC